MEGGRLKASKMKLRRIRFGISQVDLGSETRISQQKISAIENGLTPTKYEAKKISDALKTSVKKLFKEVK